MPILKDMRQTKVIALPSYEGSEVEIYDSVLLGASLALDYKAGSEVETMVKAFPHIIKRWNFTNEAGDILPVNEENLGILKSEDVTYLIEQFTGFQEEVKKK